MRRGAVRDERYLLIDRQRDADIAILADLLADGTSTVDVAHDDTTALMNLDRTSYDCIVATVSAFDARERRLLDRVRVNADGVPLVLLLSAELPAALEWVAETDASHALWFDSSRLGQVVDSVRSIQMEAALDARLEALRRLRATVLTAPFDVFEHPTLPAIETELCSQFSSTGLYDAVWYARYDDGDDAIVPQVARGVDDDYLDRLSISDVNLDAVSCRQSEGHRQTTILAPVRYDDTVFGVLALSTTRPVDDAETSLVEDVTMTVARTIEAIASDDTVSTGTAPVELFSLTVSHELRNHVQSLRMQLDRLREGATDGEQIDVHLDRLERLSDEAELLATDTIDQASLEATDLTAVVDAVRERNPSMSAEVTVLDTRTIRAHRPLLELLVENLVRNARDHAGPDVTVRVGSLEDGFYVEDTGVGIPDTEHGFIFGWEHSGGDSTGIGLGIVARIVELHGWEIDVVESSEAGARFEITGVEGYDDVSIASSDVEL